MSPVLALDMEDPICRDCVTALGGAPRDARMWTSGPVPCKHCGNERQCAAVRDYEFPAELRRKTEDLAEALRGRK